MFVKKFEDSAVEFIAAHPKFTRYAVTGTTALATVGGSAIVASADGETSGSTASTTDTVIDTIVAAMGDALSSVAGKVIPAAVGVGIVFVAASLAWRWFKRMAYN